MKSIEMWVMDIRVRIACDDPSVLGVCAEALSAWRAVGPGQTSAGMVQDAIALELRSRSGMEASVDDEGTGGSRIEHEPVIEVDGPSLRLRGRGVSAVADVVSQRAVCIADDDLLRDSARVAAELLDPVLLFLLTRRGRVPIHAAGVLVGDTAVVLAGRSGVGKSTLSLAALEAGLPILSDDAVYVQLEPSSRVWGYPRPIRLDEGGRTLAHLYERQRGSGAPPASHVGMAVRKGKAKAALLPPVGSFALGAERGALCLLVRGNEAAIRPIGTDEALSRMRSTIDPGFDHFLDELPAAVGALAEGGCWELAVSPHLDDVLAILRDTFDP